MTALERSLRLLAAPLRRLLDGRFADVNRRVEGVRATIEHEEGAVEKLGRDLAAYSVTQNEAASYTAIQVRLLEEALITHEERVLGEVGSLREAVERLEQRGYVERLNRTSSGPLGELDGALAAAVNLAIGHSGFAAQAGMWFNPAVNIELSEGGAHISDVNERIVELPFAFGALARLVPPARILDIGGAESTFALSAASLGYLVTVVDPQGVPYEHPNLTTVKRRLEDWEPEDGPFAAAFLISAIEHFGLGAYGEPVAGGRADHAAVARVRELLADDGLLALTTRYGESSVDELERVYDDEDLDGLLAGWEILERRTVVRTNRQIWLPGIEGPSGTALIAATPPRRT